MDERNNAGTNGETEGRSCTELVPNHAGDPLRRRIGANLDAGLPLHEATELALAGKVRVRARSAQQGEA
jgi:hypothetical protein